MTYTTMESEAPLDDGGFRAGIQEEEFRRFNYNLLIIQILLFGIGMFNLVSATAVQDKAQGLYMTQLMWFGIGSLLSAIIVVFMHYSFFSRTAWITYFGALTLLALTLVMGRSSLGARRWLQLGPLGMQPSEFMKLALVVALAKYFEDDKKVGGYTLRDLVPPAIIVGIPTGLIMLQPDLGTALILIFVATSMMLFIKIHPRTLAILAMCALVAAPVAYRFGLKPYQRQRLVTFLDPMTDPKGAGYNSIQSMIAVGSGKFWGKGWKKGTQSRLNFLPEHHTDFIYSVYAEELGFAGSIVLLVLYLILLMNGLSVAYQSNDKFAMILALGISFIFFWHIVVNLGMVMGLLPIVGVPLPFMSYGGSSLLTAMIGTAILMNIANKKFMF
ncbi:MAG TPA: rod shape-determining protein RodA [Bdellovibrionota bacterium]|nr:rod shape-determining protein RodA [Bdellovibrionota bacterium]